jgi:hypothetical protein
MKTMTVLIPWRTAAAVVWVVARELPLSSVRLKDALIVLSTADARQERRAGRQAGKVDQTRWVPRRDRNHHVGRFRQPEWCSSGWYVPVDDHLATIGSDELRNLQAGSQHCELALNSLRRHGRLPQFYE